VCGEPAPPDHQVGNADPLHHPRDQRVERLDGDHNPRDGGGAGGRDVEGGRKGGYAADFGKGGEGDLKDRRSGVHRLLL
jgi:hypothetical protein